MRWFQHRTKSSDDGDLEGYGRKIERLFARRDGHALYGLFNLTLEAVAGEFQKGSHPSLTLPVKAWGSRLHLYGNKVRSPLRSLAHLELIKLSSRGDELTVSIPILLILRDETARKFGRESGIIPEQDRTLQLQSDLLTNLLTDAPPPAVRDASNDSNGHAIVSEFLTAIQIKRVLEEPPCEAGTEFVANVWAKAGRPTYLPHLLEVLDRGLTEAKAENVRTPRILWRQLRVLRKTHKQMTPDQKTEHYYRSQRAAN